MPTLNISSQPPPPPTSALPQLPVSKIRTPGAVSSDNSRTLSVAAPPGRPSLRTPSKIGKPLNGNHSSSSPNIPTLAPSPQSKSGKKEEDRGGDDMVRRSVSIANFPQPPKVRRAGHRSSADADPMAKDDRDAAARSASLRLKKLKTKASTGSINQIYSTSSTPSLLNSNGNGKSIHNSKPRRQSSGLASVYSRPESPSSSAEDSYSTSATTYDDGDENRRGRDSGGKETEGKGNVIVSVRVKPDAGGDKNSGKDFLVDARQSLIGYKGREANDYYYGKSLHLPWKRHGFFATCPCFCGSFTSLSISIRLHTY